MVSSMAPPFFDFEQDFVGSLRCIPMVVRHHLDTCGVKLKLDHWNRFSPSERQALVDWPCETPDEAATYREQLQALITQKTGAPAKTLDIPAQQPWQQLDKIPAQVTQKFEQQEKRITLSQWQALSELQRFALVKLSRPSHENLNFIPALEEFGLASSGV